MVRTESQLVAEYQNLLTENESLSTLERAVKLVWDIFGARVRPTDKGLVYEPSSLNGADKAKRFHRLSKGQRVFNVTKWREVVAQPAGNREHRRLRACCASFYLTGIGGESLDLRGR